MAAPRNWERLSETTRKRYLSAGRKHSLTDTQIRQHYESGGNLGAWRGHRPRPGVSERQWGKLVAAAKAAKMQQDIDGHYSIVLESLLQKGFKYSWIMARLDEKKESRDTYRSRLAKALRRNGVDAGWQPGRARYHKREHPADIELYYYH